MLEGYFKNSLNERNCVKYRNGMVKIEGLVTKAKLYFPLGKRGFVNGFFLTAGEFFQIY